MFKIRLGIGSVQFYARHVRNWHATIPQRLYVSQLGRHINYVDVTYVETGDSMPRRSFITFKRDEPMPGDRVKVGRRYKQSIRWYTGRLHHVDVNLDDPADSKYTVDLAYPPRPYKIPFRRVTVKIDQIKTMEAQECTHS